jgi:hypothetical protein
MRRLFVTVVRSMALSLVVFTVGCGGPENVSGKVTYKGKPVTYGSVTMFASDGVPRYGELGEGGAYTVEDVPVGEVQVAVQSPNPVDAALAESDKFGKQDPGTQQALPAKPGVIPGKWFPIPSRYENVRDSGLVFTVESGANSFDIDLKP